MSTALPHFRLFVPHSDFLFPPLPAFPTTPLIHLFATAESIPSPRASINSQFRHVSGYQSRRGEFISGKPCVRGSRRGLSPHSPQPPVFESQQETRLGKQFRLGARSWVKTRLRSVP